VNEGFLYRNDQQCSGAGQDGGKGELHGGGSILELEAELESSDEEKQLEKEFGSHSCQHKRAPK